MSPRFLTIISCLVVASCAAPQVAGPREPFKSYDPGIPFEWQADFLGNIYPMECRKDLSFIDKPVNYVPEKRLEEIVLAFGGDKFIKPGITFNGLNVKKEKVNSYGTIRAEIYINNELPEWKQVQALHHERCHVLVPGWKHKGGE